MKEMVEKYQEEIPGWFLIKISEWKLLEAVASGSYLKQFSQGFLEKFFQASLEKNVRIFPRIPERTVTLNPESILG